MKIVINRCYGGFGLSALAIYELIKMDSTAIKKMSISEYSSTSVNFEDYKNKYGYRPFEEIGDGYVWDGMITTLFKDDYAYMLNDDYKTKSERTHPDVLKIVKSLGKKANGSCASLKIVNVPDDVKWHIDEYDGFEHVAENHRTWE